MEKEVQVQGGEGVAPFLSQAHRAGHGALSSPVLPALSLFLYTHRRMAITGDDVCLDQIVPISRDFTLEEGAQGGWVVGVPLLWAPRAFLP